MRGIDVLVDGLDHPEAVCWDPGAEVLWAGGEAGQVYRVDLEAGEAEEVARARGCVPCRGRRRAGGAERLWLPELPGVRARRDALRLGLRLLGRRRRPRPPAPAGRPARAAVGCVAELPERLRGDCGRPTPLDRRKPEADGEPDRSR